MRFSINKRRSFIPHRTLLLLLALLIALTGCTTTSVYEPEHLANGDGRALIVHTKDGRRIRFAPGEYVFNGDAHGSITGKGQITTNTVSNAAAPWEGTLTLDEIQLVSVTEANLFGIATLGIFVAAGAFVVFLLVAAPHLTWY